MASGESLALGRYVLLRRLRTEGALELHLGLQRSMAGVEKLVILKRLTRELARDQRLADELLEEARIAGQLSHVNIVQVFDVGADEGSYYFAMEHVHGKSLRSVLCALDDRSVVMPPEHAIHIAIQICAALSHAHEQRDMNDQRVDIVHGGLSPDNVFVTFAGGVKIAEFGLRASKKDTGPAPIAYPAPEQVKGEPPDARTDLYALGMLLLELTTGKAPLNRPPEFAPGYPPKLAAILLQAAARRRTHRHQSATELLAQLETFAQKAGVRTSPVAFGHFLEELFPDAEEQHQRERREARLVGTTRDAERDETRDEALTIPDTNLPALAQGNFTPGVLEPESADLELELESAGLRPFTSAPPAVRTWKPRRESNGYFAVMAALGIGVVLGLFAHAFVRDTPIVVRANATSPAPRAAEGAERGSIEVESEPAGASIFVEGELMPEVTPATLRKLPLGRALKVRVARSGFDTYQADVTLSPERPRERLSAHLSPAALTLHLAIDAPDPAVWIDGKYTPSGVAQGLTSSRTVTGLAVDQDHKIAVSAPGRIGKVIIFRSEQGGEKRLDLKLDSVRGSR